MSLPYQDLRRTTERLAGWYFAGEFERAASLREVAEERRRNELLAYKAAAEAAALAAAEQVDSMPPRAVALQYAETLRQRRQQQPEQPEAGQSDRPARLRMMPRAFALPGHGLPASGARSQHPPQSDVGAAGVRPSGGLWLGVRSSSGLWVPCA